MYRTTTEQLLQFIEESPSPFHVIANLKKQLAEAGFEELREEVLWNPEPGKNYYVIRNGSSIIAFKIPKSRLLTVTVLPLK